MKPRSSIQPCLHRTSPPCHGGKGPVEESRVFLQLLRHNMYQATGISPGEAREPVSKNPNIHVNNVPISHLLIL